jgi:RNA polymerase sigma-70 factor (ECF subfamily)
MLIAHDELRSSACAVKDEAFFNQLYSTHRDKIFNYAFLITQSQLHAEEVTQEVFIKIWLYRYKWEEIECFEAWIYTMMRNRTLDYIKKLSNERTLLNDAMQHHIQYSTITDDTILSNECFKIVEKAMNALSPQRRMVYVLMRVHGWKRDKVAKVLGVSPNTVRVQMGEALKSIKKYITATSKMPDAQ